MGQEISKKTDVLSHRPDLRKDVDEAFAMFLEQRKNDMQEGDSTESDSQESLQDSKKERESKK